jgi:hypothetical protein
VLLELTATPYPRSHRARTTKPQCRPEAWGYTTGKSMMPPEQRSPTFQPFFRNVVTPQQSCIILGRGINDIHDTHDGFMGASCFILFELLILANNHFASRANMPPSPSSLTRVRQPAQNQEWSEPAQHLTTSAIAPALANFSNVT